VRATVSLSAQLRRQSDTSLHSHRVLIVDDDCGIRETVAELLEDEGYVTSVAANGRDALRQIEDRSASPCLIILDLRMPVMDGASFREQQLRVPKLASIPTIVVTAEREPRQRVEVMAVNGWLEKPLDIDRLLDVVRDRCSIDCDVRPPIARDPNAGA
jgi:CheY-like chemotaxis protein